MIHPGYIHLRWWYFQEDREVLNSTGVLVDGFSFRPFAQLSAFMLISSRFCLRHLTQHFRDSTLRSVVAILATSSPLINPFFHSFFPVDTSCPCSLSSLLFLPCHLWLPLILSATSVSSNHLTPFQIHPHQLADSVHFTQRAQCSDPWESMADKSMLSLFSMPLLPSIFFPVTLLFVETWTLLN